MVVVLKKLIIRFPDHMNALSTALDYSAWKEIHEGSHVCICFRKNMPEMRKPVETPYPAPGMDAFYSTVEKVLLQ